MAAKTFDITADGDTPVPVSPGRRYAIGVSEKSSGDWSGVTITLRWKGASSDVDFLNGEFTADKGIEFVSPVEDCVLNATGITGGKEFLANLAGI